MCGIFAILSKDSQAILPKTCCGYSQTLRELAYRQSGKQRHRGPDETGVAVFAEHGVALVHERLAVIGVKTGRQPLMSEDGNVLLVANAEIYNYRELSNHIAKTRPNYKPKSDCNVIVELYEEYGERLLGHITGMFAFILYDKNKKTVMIARDPFGIMPLYIGQDLEGNLWISSEMKCMIEYCKSVKNFPPGHFIMGYPKHLNPQPFFIRPWQTEIPNATVDIEQLKLRLEAAVRSHLQCDVPYGALLSGGVDSSLIASIATKIMRERDPSYRLRTFSVGMIGSPDFKHARMVADYIGSDHTEVTFTVEECLDGVRDLIYHLESYDTATVRCSLPMFYMARYIKSTGIKMILSGEGADEIFGGYLYFFKAPKYSEFHKEMVTRLDQLHVSDILRANKVTMSKGLELRVPFLDTSFVDYVMSVRPEDKIPGPLNCYSGVQSHRMEKYILRKAFEGDYLPPDVLWRQKEQFSDGVGYDLIEGLPQFATKRVTDAEFAKAPQRFPINTPKTKEAYYYRCIFDEMFPGEATALTVEKWAPRLDWGCPEDPSGRAQEAHENRLKEYL
ncbi:uncharacterized protein [Musca autumnalis]|uniref:uncharacterized protein n=1 Tax=Musca autumnalis TaxID=221902 RepID=UPI003CE93186